MSKMITVPGVGFVEETITGHITMPGVGFYEQTFSAGGVVYYKTIEGSITCLGMVGISGGFLKALSGSITISSLLVSNFIISKTLTASVTLAGVLSAIYFPYSPGVGFSWFKRRKAQIIGFISANKSIFTERNQ